MKRLFKGSWQTTLAGILTLIAVAAANLAAIFDGDPATNFSLESIIGVAVGFGLISARDNNKRSEDVNL